MFLKLNESSLINLDQIIKIEKGNNAQDGCFIVFYNSIHGEIKFTKIHFQQDEKARDDFFDRIITQMESLILK